VKKMGVENLDKVFKPKSIAVVGASNKFGSPGHTIFRNLVGSGYEGVVYPVNPKHESIQGVESYKSIEEIPKVADLAIIATSSKVVNDVVERCGKKGIKGILIISAGFKEIGEKGVELEKELMQIKEKYNLRIIGPNCVGFILPFLNLNATFARTMPMKGNIALFSQSGAICGAILDWAAAANVGFSSFISVGSMLDVDFGDLIDYFGMDVHTRSIVLYIESITDARKFMSAAKSFARNKPIIVIKSGRFKEGAKAATSHTGAMAGEDSIYDAAFKRAGIVRVKEISDLFNCSAILAKQPRPTGPNIAIVTNAGGPGVLATDAVIEKGGKLADLTEKTMKNLNSFLPVHWSKANPVDIIGDSDEEMYEKSIEACLQDENVDGLLTICVPQVVADPRLLADRLISLSKKSVKPLMVSFPGEQSVYHARQILNKNNVPAYPNPEEAVESYMYLYNYARNLELIYETPQELDIKPSPSNQQKLKEIMSNALKQNRNLLDEAESKEFIEMYGIKTSKPEVAKSEDEAVKIAKKIGYPIVIKIYSSEITHKSDAGGVVLDIQCEEVLRNEYKNMLKTVKEKFPDKKIEGITIQKMIKNKGSELIIGSKKDPIFGSVLLFGMGGIYTELFKDKAIGFPPLNQVLARRIMEETKAYKLLKGFRGLPPVNIEKVEETLINFSQMIIDHPEIEEVDINPLIAKGEELIAVDARIVLDKDYKNKPHLVISPYPKKYIKEVKLSDGKKVTLRPIKPEDEYMWQEMFNSFSQETVRFRFFRLIKDTPHEMRTRYCNIDYDRELGIVAEIEEDNKKRLIGVVRIILNPGQEEEAEFALVVSDKWQRLGLGSEFLDYMFEIGKDKNLKKIYGIVLKDNQPMISICKEKNFKFTEGDPGEYKIEYELK
jgi:acetyltransferase